jgi:hypothetical protein
MRLIIHLGLNKAASTWLQHSLAKSHGSAIYYEDYDEYFLNHASFYELLKEGSSDKAYNWLSHYSEKARLQKCDVAVVSSEDIWQELPFNKKALSTLIRTTASITQETGTDTRFLLIKRNFKKWAFSYCLQLLNNEGSLTPKRFRDLFRSSTNISQFAVAAAKSIPASSLDIATCDSPDFQDKIRTLIDPSFQGLTEKINISRSTSIGESILAANLRCIYSTIKGLHPNCSEVDLHIDLFRAELDALLENPSATQARQLFTVYHQRYSELINGEIDNCRKSMSTEEQHFWDS